MPFVCFTLLGNTSEGIDTIRSYEEDFFRNSRLFK